MNVDNMRKLADFIEAGTVKFNMSWEHKDDPRGCCIAGQALYLWPECARITSGEPDGSWPNKEKLAEKLNITERDMNKIVYDFGDRETREENVRFLRACADKGRIVNTW